MFRWMKLRIFDDTPPQTPCVSNNFLSRTRNFGCPALIFLSFPDKLTFVRNTSHTGPLELNNVNLSANDKKWRAGHLKFLVCLEKLEAWSDVRFDVSSKMCDFIRRNISLNDFVTYFSGSAQFNVALIGVSNCMYTLARILRVCFKTAFYETLTGVMKYYFLFLCQ